MTPCRSPGALACISFRFVSCPLLPQLCVQIEDCDKARHGTVWVAPATDCRLMNSHTLEITTEPSPTAEATRLTEPARTSPTANTPGNDVAYGEAAFASAKPVMTNPLAWRLT